MIINYRKYSKMKRIFSSALLILICLIFFSLTGCSKVNQKQSRITSIHDQEAYQLPPVLSPGGQGMGVQKTLRAGITVR